MAWSRCCDVEEDAAAILVEPILALAVPKKCYLGANLGLVGEESACSIGLESEVAAPLVLLLGLARRVIGETHARGDTLPVPSSNVGSLPAALGGGSSITSPQDSGYILNKSDRCLAGSGQ